MTSISPSPNSSPAGVPPNSTTSSPPPAPSTTSSPPPAPSTFSSPPPAPSTSSSPPPAPSTTSSPPPAPSTSSSSPPAPSTSSSPPPAPSTSSPPPDNSPPPTTTQPNATSETPLPSTPSDSSSPPPAQSPPPPSTPSDSSSPPPAQSPPPPVPSAPPPVSLSPRPPTPVVPPPEPPTSPPALPPPPTTTPVFSPPPSPPSAPPPSVVSPPPPISSPPPVSPSPPAATSPPPQSVSSPPPSPGVSPPPHVNSPPPLPSSSPPPPTENPPKSSPAPPTLTPPPPPSVSPPATSSPPPTDSPPATSSPPPTDSPPATSSRPPTDSPPATSSPPPTDSPPTTSSPPINQTQPTPSSPSPPSPLSSIPPAVPPPNNSSTGVSSLPPTQLLPTPPIQDPTNNSSNPSSGTPDNANSGGNNSGTSVAIGVIAGIVVLSLIGVAVWFFRKQKRKVTGYHAGHVMPSPLGSSPVSDTSYIKAYSSAPLIGSASGSDFIYSPSESGGLGNPRSSFTYEELMEVTNGFSEQNLLGEGGFGCVYKGILADGREVAVKQLKIGGSQGEREFSAEVETISRVHHRHLVSLVGYCISDHQRLLVYDFVPNNTLHHHLHVEGRPVMDWTTRIKVATGAARGISYLHEDCHPRIIHRDIKSSNILLDNNFDAQVSDFGLAKLALDVNNTHISTRVMGTFGYMAPEYASSGKLTEKSDVYSYGVVLLELITGRKPVDVSQPMGDESLVEWARPLMSAALDNQELEGLVDSRLGKNYVESEVFLMIVAAAACVRHSAAKRPRMAQVVRAFDGIGDSSDLTNGIRPGQSEVFNSGQQSAEIRMFRRMAFGSQDYSSEMFSRSSWQGQQNTT